MRESLPPFFKLRLASPLLPHAHGPAKAKRIDELGLEYHLLALLVFVCHSDHHEHFLSHHAAQQPLGLHAGRGRLRICICHNVEPLRLLRLHLVLLLRRVRRHQTVRLKRPGLAQQH